jgi:hypothetical protein
MKDVLYTSPEYRRRIIGIELVRFTGEAGHAATGTVDFQVLCPSSRVFLGMAIGFYANPGQAPIVASGATWGPLTPQTFDPVYGYADLKSLVTAGTSLPDSREVNSNAKRYLGRIAAPGAPDGTKTGSWRLVVSVEPNQFFVGADEEWDRIAASVSLSADPQLISIVA